MLATAASAAPILIGITGGSITFPGAQNGATNLGLTNFSVITATGSILGTTPGGSPAAWMHSGPSPITINPSLNIYTAGYDSGPGNTNLHLTVPDPVAIYNPGGNTMVLDNVDGLFSANSITLDLTSLPQSFSLEVPFSGQVEMTHWSFWNPPQPQVLLNDYIFTGSGVAELHFYKNCPTTPGYCELGLGSAVYTFAPEPATSPICLFVASLGGAWFLHRRRQTCGLS